MLAHRCKYKSDRANLCKPNICHPALLAQFEHMYVCLFLSQLDGTVDLDERRLIRSAIRDLRRREIEDMEAALASKRFRPTRLKQQEDKENQHR